MPEIEIRPILQDDIKALSEFEHGYYSNYVWQMTLNADEETAKGEFQRLRLPRRVFVPYPRERQTIFRDFDQAEAFLVALEDKVPVGYVKVLLERNSGLALISDLVVSSASRRQGIASALLIAVLDFASYRRFYAVIIELQLKNDPAISMVNKLGFKYCGFRDLYFPNKELAIFFSRFTH